MPAPSFESPAIPIVKQQRALPYEFLISDSVVGTSITLQMNNTGVLRAARAADASLSALGDLQTAHGQLIAVAAVFTVTAVLTVAHSQCVLQVKPESCFTSTIGLIQTVGRGNIPLSPTRRSQTFGTSVKRTNTSSACTVQMGMLTALLLMLTALLFS